uniref:Ring finger protein 32 n=1 Tax=Labrus bergylta TaxID=56723 RepID=A0A3Q3EBZ9_9LABR
LFFQGFTLKGSNNLVVNSAAFQDHITRTVLRPHFPLTDPLLRSKRREAARNPQARGTADRRLQRPDPQEEEEREYVLDAALPPLTLAQKLGLVARPAGRLTEDEWRQVKARSVQQGESAQPCAICKEDFHLQPQVLLSCSHIFHRACLHAFERFSKACKKCCPMCRKEPYETRVIRDAARLFRHRCATRIQACWRGYVARKRYRKLSKSVCPKDERLRRKFFEAKVSLNDSFVRYCHTDTEAFLSDINRSLSSSRRVFQQLERRNVSEPGENDWDRIQSQVSSETHVKAPYLQPWPTHRPTVLLSCSHIFHQPCLEAFEAFTVDSRPSCPLCRSAYHKKLI